MAISNPVATIPKEIRYLGLMGSPRKIHARLPPTNGVRIIKSWYCAIGILLDAKRKAQNATALTTLKNIISLSVERGIVIEKGFSEIMAKDREMMPTKKFTSAIKVKGDMWVLMPLAITGRLA